MVAKFEGFILRFPLKKAWLSAVTLPPVSGTRRRLRMVTGSPFRMRRMRRHRFHRTHRPSLYYKRQPRTPRQTVVHLVLSPSHALPLDKSATCEAPTLSTCVPEK